MTKLIKEVSEEDMAMVYALLIMKGKKTFMQVPDTGTLRTQVTTILIEDMEFQQN